MGLTKKQKIVILTGIILVLGIIACCILKAAYETDSGVIDDSSYSCTWEVHPKNTVKVKITGIMPEKHEWSISANSTVIKVVQGENPNEFTIKAVDSGPAEMTIKMRNTDLPVENGADFYLSFSTDSKNKISINSFIANELKSGCIEADNGMKVYWRDVDADSITIYLTDTDWIVQSRNGVSFAGPTKDGDMLRFDVFADESTEEKKIVLIDNNAGEGVEICFTQSDGVLSIEKCSSARAAEPEPEEVDAEYQALLDAISKAETDEEKERLTAQYWAEQREKSIAAYAAGVPENVTAD